MATHSSVLVWWIPWTGEPGELPSMGSHRVGHDWSDLAAAAAFIGKDWCWNWSSGTLVTWWEQPLIGKDPDSGKDWGQKEKGATEDEMVGWHHQLNGHEIEQTPGDSKGQGSLAWCSSWDREESEMTYWLNNIKQNLYAFSPVSVSFVSLIHRPQAQKFKWEFSSST